MIINPGRVLFFTQRHLHVSLGVMFGPFFFVLSESGVGNQKIVRKVNSKWMLFFFKSDSGGSAAIAAAIQ